MDGQDLLAVQVQVEGPEGASDCKDREEPGVDLDIFVLLSRQEAVGICECDVASDYNARSGGVVLLELIMQELPVKVRCTKLLVLPVALKVSPHAISFFRGLVSAFEGISRWSKWRGR